MINAKLVVVGGETKTKEVELTLPTVIGRGQDVKLTLPHPLVSRKHCEIFETNGRLVVKDLGSLNGTYVDNNRITEDETLEPGHLLTIGTVTFRAVYEPAEKGSPDFVKMSSRDTEVKAQALVDTQYPEKKTEYPEKKIDPAAPHPSRATVPELASAPDDPNEELVAANDLTDSSINLGDLTIDMGEPTRAVESSIPSDVFGDNAVGSVSLSSLENLPNPPEQLSFSGGVAAENEIPEISDVEYPVIDEKGDSDPDSKPARKAK